MNPIRISFFLMVLFPLYAASQRTGEAKSPGKLSGQWRTYYMNTVNQGNLKDFTALASGGVVKYTYTFGTKLQLAGAVYNTTNLGLQDLTLPDNTTNRLSRYEEGLFDRMDLENDAIFLLGELYLDFKVARHTLSLGRLKINTPLINPQDGRMIPTLAQGAWYNYRSKRENLYKLGVFNKIAPRSTGRFYGIGESIGTYPMGRNIDGSNHDYFGNTQAGFVALANADIQVNKSLQLVFWNTYVDNVSNSAYFKPKLKLGENWTWEGEWLHQNRVGSGGNELDQLRYFTSKTANILGARLAYHNKKAKFSLAYDRILGNGQFISPREWGREDLFTFQKRERSEGTGDNHALVFYYHAQWVTSGQNVKVQSIFSLGRHWKPSVTDSYLNKYAMPDYTQINFDFAFNFKKLKNLSPELLVVSKIGHGDIPDNPNLYLNKVGMLHIDLILNYNF